jgi:hypothetical protein
MSNGHITITQTNLISNSPSLTCRTQVLDLGPLPSGPYDVAWTTTENFISLPTPQIRVRTLSFAIQSPTGIPTADREVLLLMVVAFGIIAMWRLRN